MKIYPSTHNVVQVKEINTDYDIPLAFINTDYSDYNIELAPGSNEFSTKRENIIVPYTTFDSLDVALFYKGGTPVPPTKKAEILIRDNNQYYYMPQKFKSFKPQNFEYTITYKKKMKYSANKIYNMKVACDDPTSTMFFINQLMKAFGDAPSRKLCPANIFVNNKDLSPLSLINKSIKESDFVFIRSNDGVHYIDSNFMTTSKAIDFDEYFKKHTNVWISVDETEYSNLQISVDNYNVNNPMLYSSATAYTSYGIPTPDDTDPRYIVHKIFDHRYLSPIYIKEDLETGAFLIISHKSFLDNIDKNISALYEVMMYIYMNGYLETDAKTEWIADVMPDYVIVNGSITKRSDFTIDVTPSRTFDIESTDAYPIKVTTIDVDNILVESITQYSITFKKKMSEAYKQFFDPIKKTAGSISMYTERNDIVFYDEADMIYEISDNILEKAYIINNNGEYSLYLKSFYNTRACISITEEVTESIPLTITEDYKIINIEKGIVYLCHKDGIVNLIFKDNYLTTDGDILAVINIDRTKEYSKVYDMRQRGGGLKEDKEDIYDLLDIGNVLGKPYRPGGSLVITLPKRLESYEDIILKAIKKHMVAEDLPIILFK
jgi:hypothetical protein